MKVGDIVICIENKGFKNRLTLKKEYFVKDLAPVNMGNLFFILDDRGKTSCFSKNRFQLLTETKRILIYKQFQPFI